MRIHSTRAHTACMSSCVCVCARVHVFTCTPAYNPGDRPSAAEALLDPFFISIPAPVHHSKLIPLVNATQQLAQLRNKTRPSFELDAPFNVEGLL